MAANSLGVKTQPRCFALIFAQMDRLVFFEGSIARFIAVYRQKKYPDIFKYNLVMSRVERKHVTRALTASQVGVLVEDRVPLSDKGQTTETIPSENNLPLR
jgi:hypothetical protein